MRAEIFLIISIVAFSLSGLFLIITLILGLKFKIFKVIGNLSGYTAKKAIQKKKEESLHTGKKPVAPDLTNISHSNKTNQISGKPTMLGNNNGNEIKSKLTPQITQKLERPANLKNMQNQQSLNSEETEVLGLSNESNETEILGSSNQTEILYKSEETEVLVNPQKNGATKINDVGGKASLNEESQQKTNITGFCVLEEITMIHTNEKI